MARGTGHPLSLYGLSWSCTTAGLTSVLANGPLGRGGVATEDMKRRIEALQDDGRDVIDALWERYVRAVAGEGFRYEYAEQQPAAATVAGG